MARLYGYQRDGADFLSGPRRGYFLADEMGLGKTVQALEAGRLVGARDMSVVCPASAVPVWHAEAKAWNVPYPVEAVSYDRAVQQGIKPVRPDVLVIDEAHYCKNPMAKRSVWTYGVMAPGASHVWSLSGTPTPNHPGELWTHARTLGGEKMGYDEFVNQYCLTRPSNYPPGYRVVGPRREHIPFLRHKMRTWLLRRKQIDVLSDLPPVRHTRLPVEAPDGVPEELLPDALPLEGLSLEEQLEVIEASTPHLASQRRMLGELKVRPVCAAISEELDSGLDKVVLMAWHRSVLDEIEAWFSGRCVRLDGSASPKAREMAVTEFQTNPAMQVFIGQVIAAGVAITLTAAAKLVFVEQSWTPGDLDQAMKRIHRIGQTRPVHIQTAYLAGSLDDAVTSVLTRKRETEMIYD